MQVGKGVSKVNVSLMVNAESMWNAALALAVLTFNASRQGAAMETQIAPPVRSAMISAAFVSMMSNVAEIEIVRMVKNVLASSAGP